MNTVVHPDDDRDRSDDGRDDTPAVAVRGGEHGLDLLGALLAEHVVELLTDLALGGVLAVDQSGDGRRDDQEGREREGRVVRERRADPRRLVLLPLLPGLNEELLDVLECVSHRFLPTQVIWSEPMRRQAKKRLLIVLGVLVLLLVALRIALEPIVERYVNHVLAKNESYSGRIEDVDIHLLRGAYVIKGTVIEKKDGSSVVPFLDIPEIDLSVEWKALLKGSIVAEIEMMRAEGQLRRRLRRVEPGGRRDGLARDRQGAASRSKINRFAVVNGQVHYVDPTAKPKVDVAVNELNVEATNLTNSEDLSGSLVATVKARGKPLDLGQFELETSLDPYADQPTFDLNATIEGLAARERERLPEGVRQARSSRPARSMRTPSSRRRMVTSRGT